MAPPAPCRRRPARLPAAPASGTPLSRAPRAGWTPGLGPPGRAVRGGGTGDRRAVQAAVHYVREQGNAFKCRAWQTEASPAVHSLPQPADPTSRQPAGPPPSLPRSPAAGSRPARCGARRTQARAARPRAPPATPGSLRPPPAAPQSPLWPPPRSLHGPARGRHLGCRIPQCRPTPTPGSKG